MTVVDLYKVILWSLSFFFLQHTKRIFLNSPRSLIVRVLVPMMIVMMYSRDRAWMARLLISQVSFVVCSCHRKFLAWASDDKIRLLNIKASCEPGLESCSGPTRVYQVLSMTHDWPVYKAIDITGQARLICKSEITKKSSKRYGDLTALVSVLRTLHYIAKWLKSKGDWLLLTLETLPGKQINRNEISLKLSFVFWSRHIYFWFIVWSPFCAILSWPVSWKQRPLDP